MATTKLRGLGGLTQKLVEERRSSRRRGSATKTTRTTVFLLRRTFDVDLRVCARCGGRTFVRAVVTEPHHIERILDVLRRQRDPPAAA